MLKKVNSTLNIFKSHLSRQIILWIFASIVVIETIILIPSVHKKEKELVDQVKEVVFGKIVWILMTYPQSSSPQLLEEIKQIQTNSNLGKIVGGSLYQENGILIGTFGEPPQLSWQEIKQQHKLEQANYDKSRYDFVFVGETLPNNSILIIRHEGNLIQQELWNYKGRIVLLVILISLFVTFVMMIVLNVIVIAPILQLRDDLLKAPEVLQNGHQPDLFYSSKIQRHDELGEVMKAFQKMFQMVSESELVLKQEQEKSERLLLNILPPSIAQKLKEEHICIAEGFAEVSILFADIVGFTDLSQRIEPRELIDLLNNIFSSFDQLCDQYHLEKIKTIGDAYMVASGLPTPREDHAQALADMALEMHEKITEFNLNQQTALSIRIGINTGSAIAGVIGKKKFIYDLWGDAVNTASRMESHGIPGSIQVTESTYNKLKDNYLFEDRGIIAIKGKGMMRTYLLLKKKEL